MNTSNNQHLCLQGNCMLHAQHHATQASVPHLHVPQAGVRGCAGSAGRGMLAHPESESLPCSAGRGRPGPRWDRCLAHLRVADAVLWHLTAGGWPAGLSCEGGVQMPPDSGSCSRSPFRHSHPFWCTSRAAPTGRACAPAGECHSLRLTTATAWRRCCELSPGPHACTGTPGQTGARRAGGPACGSAACRHSHSQPGEAGREKGRQPGLGAPEGRREAARVTDCL